MSYVPPSPVAAIGDPYYCRTHGRWQDGCPGVLRIAAPWEARDRGDEVEQGRRIPVDTQWMQDDAPDPLAPKGDV